MIIQYFCPHCRILHDANSMKWIESEQGYRCAVSNVILIPRGIPDDPDDPQYDKPRCPVCAKELIPGQACDCS